MSNRSDGTFPEKPNSPSWRPAPENGHQAMFGELTLGSTQHEGEQRNKQEYIDGPNGKRHPLSGTDMAEKVSHTQTVEDHLIARGTPSQRILSERFAYD